MEKYLKSIDRSMKGIHEELKKMNRPDPIHAIKVIDVKHDDNDVKIDVVNRVANDIANQINNMASSISRGI